MESILISLLYLCLQVAVIIFVAVAIVWILKLCGIELDPTVYKVGKIIVMLLVLIAVIVWLFSVYPQLTGAHRLSPLGFLGGVPWV
jgi:hypothetical protein